MEPKRWVASALMVVAVSACGGSGGDASGDYCSAVGDAEQQIADLDDLDVGDAKDATEFIRGWAGIYADLSDQAPASLVHEFRTVNDPLDAIHDALRGTDVAELFATPKGAALFEAFYAPDIRDAAGEIDDATLEACDVRLRSERKLGSWVEAVTPLVAGAATSDTVATPDTTEPATVPPTPAPTLPPTAPPTTPPPLVLPTNPAGTAAPSPTSPPQTLVPEPTQEEAQAFATAIHDTWPALSPDESTCVAVEILRIYPYDYVVAMLDNQDPALDQAAYDATIICGVDPNVIFG